jgi:hypothetical protein
MMTQIDATELGDGLHRLAKLTMDTGEAATVEEAMKIFSTYRLAIIAGPDALLSPVHQAALLTIINTGARSLLGGIEVRGIEDETPLLVPVPGYSTLAEAVIGLGGRLVTATTRTAPHVVLGDVAVNPDDHPLALRATFSGWCGGVAPLRTNIRLAEKNGLTVSGALAGALAVTEVFQYFRGSNAAAGRREVGLSLWRPELGWLEQAALGPQIDRLPSAAWLIGLGNLGQAYLWILSLLPYAMPSDVHLVLQDFDVLKSSNKSTSVLTSPMIIGQKKSRAMAAWAEQRGFQTTIVERPFSANFRISADDPPVALCGVDNGVARAALEDIGFARIIEAGLGKGTSEFLALRFHGFPGPRKARNIWGDNLGATVEAPKLDLPAYRDLATKGVNQCGLTSLAGRTVGAPFVGVVAATLVISELLRLANGAHGYDLVDCHLRAIDHRTAIKAAALPSLNPGTTDILK